MNRSPKPKILNFSGMSQDEVLLSLDNYLTDIIAMEQELASQEFQRTVMQDFKPIDTQEGLV